MLSFLLMPCFCRSCYCCCLSCCQLQPSSSYSQFNNNSSYGIIDNDIYVIRVSLWSELQLHVGDSPADNRFPFGDWYILRYSASSAIENWQMWSEPLRIMCNIRVWLTSRGSSSAEMFRHCSVGRRRRGWQRPCGKSHGKALAAVIHWNRGGASALVERV